MGKKPKPGKLPEMQGEQTIVDSGAPSLKDAISITMELAHQNIIEGPDMEPVAKRQIQAIKKVQKFLDRSYPLRKEIRAQQK